MRSMSVFVAGTSASSCRDELVCNSKDIMVLALFPDEKRIMRHTQRLELPSIYDPRWCVDCRENGGTVEEY